MVLGGLAGFSEGYFWAFAGFFRVFLVFVAVARVVCQQLVYITTLKKDYVINFKMAGGCQK